MKIINLYGGPGTGKSTTAAGVFYLMKTLGYRIELVTEYAKELCWENRLQSLNDQLYIFAKQQHRLERLRKHDLEYVVTDSPLLLSIAYDDGKSKIFKELVYEKYNQYNNIDILLNRVKPYQKYGREQEEDSARLIDKLVCDVLYSGDCPGKTPWRLDADEVAPQKIVKLIEELK